MARIRRAAVAALVLLVSLAVGVGATSERRLVTTVDVSLPRAAVPWPPSTTVLVAEVVTGGGSASDEYVELTNASPAPVDLGGLELVYVTATGSTVTRKATWTSPRPLGPGSHLLVANAAGSYAPLADATYSGGLAATGGALVVRPIGGAAMDAIGWGDAANDFVEGGAAAAPPAGSSIERRPGGAAGNGTDTNDNAADWVVVGPASTPARCALTPAWAAGVVIALADVSAFALSAPPFADFGFVAASVAGVTAGTTVSASVVAVVAVPVAAVAPS